MEKAASPLPTQSPIFHALNREAESCRSQSIHVAAENGPEAEGPLIVMERAKVDFQSATYIAIRLLVGLNLWKEEWSSPPLKLDA